MSACVYLPHFPCAQLRAESMGVCRRRGGVEWGLQRKIGLYLCPLVASGPQQLLYFDRLFSSTPSPTLRLEYLPF